MDLRDVCYYIVTIQNQLKLKVDMASQQTFDLARMSAAIDDARRSIEIAAI